MRYRPLRAAGLLLACAFALSATLPALAAPPRRDPQAQGNDCVACHGDSKVLGARHKPVKAMKLADCTECHERKTDDTLIGKLPGSHLHQLVAVGCADCHGATDKPEAVEAEKCLSCHGPLAKLVQRTAKVKPENPHHSPHWGDELDCTLCHQQHRKSEDYCAECHRFNYKVP